MKSIVSKFKHKIFSSDIAIPPAEKVLPYVYSIVGLSFAFGLVTTITGLNKSTSKKQNHTIEKNFNNEIAKKNIDAIIKRNIFNVTGAIPDAESNGQLVCPEIPIKSDLPYKISGIVFGGSSESSIVQFESSGSQSKLGNSFKLGDTLPMGGKLAGIQKNRILVTNKNCPEFIDLIYPTPPKSRDTKALVGNTGTGYKENGFERNGNVSTTSKQWVNNILNNNFAKTLEEAKASPYLVGGQVKGFQLTSITPNSVYSKLGFQNGDIVTSINNIQLNDAARAIQTLNSMRNENSINVQILRNGKQIELKANIQ
ncbi:PDZ domain-containing protein [Fluviispira multicolorata]|uniref:PDZ domain-containing protein n=1 Tax=Fluviispira multicolorata TaxID=2654512 RepID=A0A833N509_9BACT|nr:PDZ domain-containing protein [Fluviispira multicolorata]KAB8032003.1 PDZ domain-containing protein [Fluviispira multicolorata]